MILLLNILQINSSVANSSSYKKDTLDHLTKNGNYTGALNYLLSLKDQSINFSDSIRVGYLIELGSNSAIVQKEGDAYNYLQEALELAEKTKNKLLINKVKVQLIEFYRKIRDYSSAQVLIKSIENDLPNNIELLSDFYHRASAVYNELHDATNGTIPKYLDTALAYSFKSLAISKKNHFLNNQYISYRELSSIYNSTSYVHSKNKTKLYMDSALMTIESSNKLTYNNIFKSKAHFFLNSKEFDSSIYYALKSVPYIDSINNYQLQMEVYWILSRAYLAKNDSLSGLKWMLKEAQSDVKHRQSYVENQLAELSTAYKVEAKDKLLAHNHIALIEADKELKFFLSIGVLLIVIIVFIVYISYKTKRKNKRLAELLKENAFLIGESNHRIKNNLQLIISLIGREVYKSNEIQPELLQISEKINAIAALHQQLYLTDKKDIISMKNYIESIEQNLRSGLIQESVQLKMEIEDFEVPIDKAVYVGLLVTELIINSLKHAFENTPLKSIKISAWKANNKSIHINYQDNGKGIEDNVSPSLVMILLKQLKANITLDNTVGYNLNLNFQA